MLSLLAYFPLNKRQPLYFFHSPIDHHLPLIPLSVWFYILLFPLLFFTPILLWQTPIIRPFLISLITANLISALIWFLIPNGVTRPKSPPDRSASSLILSYLYKYDGDTNGFPSGHIMYACLCTYFLTVAYPSYLYPLSMLCVLICLSIITTKQHYLFDYVFTPPLAILIIELTKYLSTTI